jgi:predicted ATPase
MNPYKIICAFTGASGTGKSTLLKELGKEGFTCIELSGRPYLPEIGDYISNKSDSINRRISYGSTVTFAKSILESGPNDFPFFSRCAIDKLAYGRVLKVGEDCHDIIIKEIKDLVIPHIKVFYLPVEFDLPADCNDEVRGNNEEIRRATDREVDNILSEFCIPHVVVTGTVEERLKTIRSNFLSYIFDIHKTNKK